MLREKVNSLIPRRQMEVLRKVLQVGLLILMAGTAALPGLAQSTAPAAPEAQPGNIIGTVVDVNDATVPGATVVLQGSAPGDHRTVVTKDDGFYEFHNVKAGVPYNITISAKGFADWKTTITLTPGQYKIITDSKLRVESVNTTMDVGYTSEQIATQQVKVEEQQRILGIIPNFYIVYDEHPEPLTAKLKFKLALRVSYDPVTIAGVAVYSGIDQAADTPNYVQGWKGYGERFGANAADGLTDILIGGAALPAILHQDPRYFYKGKGTTKSRILYAMAHPFVCKGDNGDWQPNYSSMGGDLASAAISNAYYPNSNRGAGLVFTNFGINTAERVVAALAEEFILSRFTTRGKIKKTTTDTAPK